ncbi:ATP-binding cassette, sub-family C (CFTR/MRP), member 4, isoform CRA_d [Homo sapiens]|uniref:ATP binding cassette subfamily C member 4 (PEL blood group) n=2 Tax=Homo sapiens TaxID=9606 RepID=Q8IWU1_HUMAN|nr:ATP-binding cassette subfamily C member 4 variant 2 [Homo sapiens]EAX08952.1 ATP-binding cassette, sub-family C (CFTR/MRP), member 4, isoform CRA_d [Homo sapiens]
MLPVYQEVKPNPLQDANLCSRVFFWSPPPLSWKDTCHWI